LERSCNLFGVIPLVDGTTDTTCAVFICHILVTVLLLLLLLLLLLHDARSELHVTSLMLFIYRVNRHVNLFRDQKM
jgi:hypothetical protein